MTAAPPAVVPDVDHRLQRAADIRGVFSARRVSHGETVVVHARNRRDDAPARWTVVAGKKVGDAVRRNRAKRRLRAILASIPLPTGIDLVVVARTDAHMAAPLVLRGDVQATVAAACTRAGAVDR